MVLSTGSSADGDPHIDYSATYTVILRGESFELTHDQLICDAPNFFTGCFLSDFREASSRVVRLSRSPALFRVLVEYMSGYNVLPLSPAALPPTMTMELALENLQRDCEFYGLDGLIPQIRKLLAARPPQLYEGLPVHGFFPCPPISLEAVMRGDLPAGVEQSAKGLGVKQADGTIIPVLIEVRNALLQITFTWESMDMYPVMTMESILCLVDAPAGPARTWLENSGVIWKANDRHLYFKVSTDREASLSINSEPTSFKKLDIWFRNLQTKIFRDGDVSVDIQTPEFDVFNKNIPISPYDPVLMARYDPESFRPNARVQHSVALHAERLLMVFRYPFTRPEGHVLGAQLTTISKVYDKILTRAV